MLNYIGPDAGEGIELYVNGTLSVGTSVKQEGQHLQEESRVVVGKVFTNNNNNYFTSVDVDELFFFNEILSSQDVTNLYNMVD